MIQPAEVLAQVKRPSVWAGQIPTAFSLRMSFWAPETAVIRLWGRFKELGLP